MKISNNVLISTEDTDIIDGNLIIPNGVKSINTDAIANYQNLTSVTIPSTIKAINYRSIYNTSVEKIIFDRKPFININLVEMHPHCFVNNFKLKTIILDNHNINPNPWLSYLAPILVYEDDEVHQIVQCHGICYTRLTDLKLIDLYDVGLVKPYRSENEDEELYYAAKSIATGIGHNKKEAILDCYENYINLVVKDKYDNINLDSYVTVAQYKEITGACNQGVAEWVEKFSKFLPPDKRRITIKKLLPLIKDQYSYKDFTHFLVDIYAKRGINIIPELEKLGGKHDRKK